MAHEIATQDTWTETVGRLGGAEWLEAEGRACGAFQRVRQITCAVDFLQIVLAYCLGAKGLRLTAAWAEAFGLASLSNVALLKRVRKALPWLEILVARQLTELSRGRSPRPVAIAAAHGRVIRLVDGTTMAKKDLAARTNGGLWRVHAMFNLAEERFDAFELTDESVGERFGSVPTIAGEIRIGDRNYLQPDAIAGLIAAGGDVIVRARWNSVRWFDATGKKADLIKLLDGAREHGFLDQPIQISRAGGVPVPLRLIAIHRPPEARAKAIASARRKAQKHGAQIKPETIAAAEWMILVTSLPKATFSLADIGELYRLRWRIEIAFKHLKSGAGLGVPPAATAAAAKAYILAHLLMILLTEPLIAEHLGDSPRRAAA